MSNGPQASPLSEGHEDIFQSGLQGFLVLHFSPHIPAVNTDLHEDSLYSESTATSSTPQGSAIPVWNPELQSQPQGSSGEEQAYLPQELLAQEVPFLFETFEAVSSESSSLLSSVASASTSPSILSPWFTSLASPEHFTPSMIRHVDGVASEESWSGTAVQNPEFELLDTVSPIQARNLYQHQHQLFYEIVCQEANHQYWGPFVPQKMYRPQTKADRKRYVEEICLDLPIQFRVGSDGVGIPLQDALRGRANDLLYRDASVFEGLGPSVSIRILWPGYEQWSKQISAKNYKKKRGPITYARLAKHVANRIMLFLKEKRDESFEIDAVDPHWHMWDIKQRSITIDDLILVSLHHVSKGSWQPQLRLKSKPSL